MEGGGGSRIEVGMQALPQPIPTPDRKKRQFSKQFESLQQLRTEEKKKQGGLMFIKKVSLEDFQ
jgi:hypothetical protein